MNGTDIRSFERFLQSLRSHDWLKGVVPGATDIDAMVHHAATKRHLFIEGKHRDGPSIWMPYGQYLGFRDLEEVPTITVWVVAEDTTSKRPGEVPGYHLLDHLQGSGGKKTTRYGQEVIKWNTERTTWSSLTLAQLQDRVRVWWSATPNPTT